MILNDYICARYSRLTGCAVSAAEISSRLDKLKDMMYPPAQQAAGDKHRVTYLVKRDWDLVWYLYISGKLELLLKDHDAGDEIAETSARHFHNPPSADIVFRAKRTRTLSGHAIIYPRRSNSDINKVSLSPPPLSDEDTQSIVGTTSMFQVLVCWQRTFFIDVLHNYTPRDLANEITAKLGMVRPRRILLYFEGKKLAGNSKCLSFFGIKSGSVIWMTIPLPGGSAPSTYDVKDLLSTSGRDPGVQESRFPDPCDVVFQGCQDLLQDIRSYKGSELPAAPEPTKGDDVWTFYRSVLAEYTSIEKAIQTGESSRVRSSNYKYLLEVWKIVKSVPHVYAIQRFFPCGPTSVGNRWSNRSQRNRAVDIAPSTQIEVIAGDICRTRYFLKVSTMDEKRLGHDLVRVQWDEVDSEAEEDECNGEDAHDQEDYISQIPVAVTARQLISAAEMAGTTPILILPYLSKGQDQGFFKYLDSIGLRYHCQSDNYPIFDSAPNVPTLQSPNVPPKRISLDITTLLSIVADVCNMPPHSIQYDKDTCAQVDQTEWEARAPTLPRTIFPYLETADELITSPSVLAKMNKLLETIGSDTEKQRAAILFGSATAVTNESLTEQYNHLTIYPIPPGIPLPIKIIPVPADFVSPLSDEDLEKLSVEAAEVYNLALSIPEGSDVATANKQLAKMVRTYYFVERNGMGVGGRVLLHQPRSLRGFGRIVHLPMKQLATTNVELSN